jgi:hypothetical protein
MPQLHHLLTQRRPTTFEIASDGGAREDIGSSGWELAVARTVLWQCKGPTFGLLPESFRAESYGVLSALLFIDTYWCKQYNIQLNKSTTLKFYCDSQLLLKRIARSRNRSWINPTECLASDYDLESAIIELLDKLQLTIQFIHVKSHQDDKTDINLLPWEAQMNVHADGLATDYLDNYADPSKIVPFIRPSQASLTIQGETINRRCAQRLRLAASSPNIRQRLILRNNWSPNTFDSINWEVPGKARATLEHNPQIFITKFAHEHLPTCQHMKRIGKAESDLCPSCLTSVETLWHILSCPNRHEWCTTLLDELSETMRITNYQHSTGSHLDINPRGQRSTKQS